MPSVPRVWESVHDAVKKALAEGGSFRRRLFGASSNIKVSNGIAYCVADNGLMAIDYLTGDFEEERLDHGGYKWSMPMPDGNVMIGAYHMPVLQVIRAI